MKKRLLILGVSTLLLASCGGDNASSGSATSGESGSWTISFDSKGGGAVSSIKVKNGEKASKPADPNRSGYSFNGWCTDSIALTPFNWDKAITADWTLFASWIASSSSESASSSSEAEESSSSEEEASSSSEETIDKGHGPEGSSLVEWYICGEGSLWGENGWKTIGGIQLYSNPASTSDKGCILGLTFAEGDTFKVTDGNTWYGFDRAELKTEGSFEGVGDQANIKCVVASTYNLYVNGYGNIWIEESK